MGANHSIPQGSNALPCGLRHHAPWDTITYASVYSVRQATPWNTPHGVYHGVPYGVPHVIPHRILSIEPWDSMGQPTPYPMGIRVLYAIPFGTACSIPWGAVGYPMGYNDKPHGTNDRINHGILREIPQVLHHGSVYVMGVQEASRGRSHGYLHNVHEAPYRMSHGIHHLCTMLWHATCRSWE